MSTTEFKKIVEGSATMKYPADQEQSVFYNPVQVQNRDLSVLMISMHAEHVAKQAKLKQEKQQLRKENPQINKEDLDAKLEEISKSVNGAELAKEMNPGLTVLDALAASGLRSIRYWKEIPGIHHVTINDLDPLAVQRAEDNVEENELQNVLIKNDWDATITRPRGILIQQGDATHEMYMSRRPPELRTMSPHQRLQRDQFDVIDLDPYGSASPFLDGAVQAVRDGGLLCITCTDMAALGGSHPETAYGRYGGIPIANAKYLQEAALRLLLYSIATSAARYGRTMEPVMSVGMAFYIRVFVRIHNNKAGVVALSTKIGTVHQSTQCPTFYTVRHGVFGERGKKVYHPGRIHPGVCEETGAPLKIGGPMWLGPLHNQDFIQGALDRLEQQTPNQPDIDLLATKNRLIGLLTSVVEELNEAPLYYHLPDLCKTLGMTCPPMQKVQAAIVNAGYQVSVYHKDPEAIKTNAPNNVVWDVLRAWCKEHPPDPPSKKKKKRTNNHVAAEKILAVEPKTEIDFTVPKELKERKKATRFPLNPEKNWGPKPASGMFSKKRKAEQEPEKNGND